MPDYSPRLNIPKPQGSENVTRALHNAMVDAIDAAAAKKTDVDAHTTRTDNPHSVTAAQVGAIPTTQRGAVNGVASLDASGTVPDAQIPATAVRTTQKGAANGVADLDASGNVPASRLGNVPPSSLLTMVNAWIG